MKKSRIIISFVITLCFIMRTGLPELSVSAIIVPQLTVDTSVKQDYTKSELTADEAAEIALEVFMNAEDTISHIEYMTARLPGYSMKKLRSLLAENTIVSVELQRYGVNRDFPPFLAYICNFRNIDSPSRIRIPASLDLEIIIYADGENAEDVYAVFSNICMKPMPAAEKSKEEIWQYAREKISWSVKTILASTHMFSNFYFTKQL